jgi:hypothetical protein
MRSTTGFDAGEIGFGMTATTTVFVHPGMAAFTPAMIATVGRSRLVLERPESVEHREE